MSLHLPCGAVSALDCLAEVALALSHPANTRTWSEPPCWRMLPRRRPVPLVLVMPTASDKQFMDATMDRPDQ